MSVANSLRALKAKYGPEVKAVYDDVLKALGANPDPVLVKRAVENQMKAAPLPKVTAPTPPAATPPARKKPARKVAATKITPAPATPPAPAAPATVPAVPPKSSTSIAKALGIKSKEELDALAGSIDTGANIQGMKSQRTRLEARARKDIPDAKTASRTSYTEQPLVVDVDPELANVSFLPGSTKSVTEQAAELGVPVTGRAPFFAQHPAGYSKSWGGNAPDPTTFTATYRDRVPGLVPDKLNADDFKVGSGLMALLGDATRTNSDLLSVMGVQLRNPVSGLGGSLYGLGERALGHRAAWSSNANIVEGQAKAIRDWQNANPGQDVYGMHVNMAPSGSDFSHQTSAVLANLIPNMGYSGDQLRAIDDYIRSGKSGLANFEGFAEDPALGLFDIMMRPGSERKRVTQRLSNVTKEAQAAGVPPHLGALARLAMAEQGLRFAPQGASGFGVVKFDRDGLLRVDPELLAKTKRNLFENNDEYRGILGGPAKLLRPDYKGVLMGDFVGQTERLIPAEIPFRSIFDRAALVDRSGNPTNAGMRFTSFKTDPSPIVTVTPEIQDNIGKYLDAIRKYGGVGYARGGWVSRDLSVKKRKSLAAKKKRA
jgi:hypothetical protein